MPRFTARDFKTALSFSADSHYVDLGDLPAFDLAYNGAMSVSIWVKPSVISGSSQAMVMKNKGVSAFNGWAFEFSASKVFCSYVTTLTSNDFIAQTTNNFTPLNTWTHLGLVFNDRVFKCYINGVSQAITVTRNTLTSGTNQTGIKCNIGGRNNSDGSNQNFQGKLDDVRIFNGVELTEAQFQDIYYTGNNPSGITPTASYLLDEGSGTTALDNSGNGRNGTISAASYSTDVAIPARTSAGTRTIVPAGSSLSFDGSTTYVVAGTSNPGTSITVGGWVKWDGAIPLQFQDLISKRTSFGSTTQMWQLYIDYLSSYKLGWICGTGGTTPHWNYVLPVGTWVHIAVSHVSTAAPLLYVNGVLFGAGDASTTMGTGTTSPITIGGSQDPGIEIFDGKLDEMFVANAILTQTDIQALKSGDFERVSNKYALWKFDEGSGSTALDASGNGRNGTITAAAYSTDVPRPTRMLV